jgi:uncharacterized membrane protein
MSKIIQSFEAKELKKRSWSVRLADDLTSTFGSFSFLTFNTLFFIFWIMMNTGNIAGLSIIDPFPFPLMTTIVSLEAIILTLIVLMSQNRQSFISNLREEIDMQVNIASEREITKILQILVKIAAKQGIKLDDKDLEEMLKNIEVSYLERKLAEQLETKRQLNIQRVVEQVSETLTPKI